MMKIIALSDTHIGGDIPEEVATRLQEADLVVHAGDFNTMEAYDAMKARCKKLIAVHGNSDDAHIKEMLPEKEIFEIEGIKFGVIHKGQYSSDPTNMRYLALEMGVKVLIYGHLHRPMIEKSDVLLICPGSPTAPRMADPTMIELTVDNGNVSGCIIKMAGGIVCDYIGFMRSL
jgi:hypothetical protein